MSRNLTARILIVACVVGLVALTLWAPMTATLNSGSNNVYQATPSTVSGNIPYKFAFIVSGVDFNYSSWFYTMHWLVNGTDSVNFYPWVANPYTQPGYATWIGPDTVEVSFGLGPYTGGSLVVNGTVGVTPGQESGQPSDFPAINGSYTPSAFSWSATFQNGILTQGQTTYNIQYSVIGAGSTGSAQFTSSQAFNLTVGGHTYSNTKSLTLTLPTGSYQYDATSGKSTTNGTIIIVTGETIPVHLNFFGTTAGAKWIILIFLSVVTGAAVAFASWVNKRRPSPLMMLGIEFTGISFGYWMNVPYVSATVLVMSVFMLDTVVWYKLILQTRSGSVKTQLQPMILFFALLDFSFIFIVNLMGLPGIQLVPPSAQIYLNWNGDLQAATSLIGSWGFFSFFSTFLHYLVASIMLIGGFFVYVGLYISYIFQLGNAPIALLQFPVNAVFETMSAIIIMVSIGLAVRILGSGLHGGGDSS